MGISDGNSIYNNSPQFGEDVVKPVFNPPKKQNKFKKFVKKIFGGSK